MTEPDIEQAIQRVKAGFVDDYATVVSAYHQRLRATVADWCPPGVGVDEVAQFAFIQAYRQLDRYRPGTSFFAWLCAIARHQLLTETEALRRGARNRENYLQHIITQQLHEATAGEAELNDTRMSYLEECLQTLRPEAQALIEERYRDRRTVESLAMTLGRTAAAVSVNLFAIRRKLRECIEAKSAALPRGELGTA
jgi:RNA polymerase sigma factor (sigma-70 family)